MYLAGACNNLECPAILVGGVEDHVHVLCRFAKTIEVAELIRELKRDSSKWIKEQDPQLADFHWQSGYGAFSVTPSHVVALKRYIANQEQHHRGESFQDEFRRLCKKYGVEIDERTYGIERLWNPYRVRRSQTAKPRVRSRWSRPWALL